MKYLYGFLCVFTFGYSFSNDYVINSFDNHPIHGTLLESAESNSILSIIISGSGPTDRDGNSTYIKSDYLKMLAEGLFENGISSYRYDKREVGNSIGNIKSGEEVKFSDFINDAISIINHFRGTNKFKKVVVIGHSEGALIGMIASRLIVDSFISISGAGEDYLTLIQRQLSIQPAYVKSMSDPIIEKLKNKELVDSVPPLINSLFNNTIQKFLIDASSYDPKDEISKLDIPVLIVQGSNDIQIEIKDAQLLHNAAIKSRLEIIQGMNHVFRQSPENRLLNMQTYGNPELPIDASLVNLIVDFLDED
ncbi:MAG: alpha/beta hydrolase [Flavobacteriaceae bacterium]|jgi:pimeloyl-ACP methyl ester carboxylesterase|nr:alpha/beta hydrolase [Flavobacteriaceae bacterium]OUV85970.1 MAG: hypothetical protein CBD05_03325 [Flavobacteriaceae bacterium TMED145]|tara:strand:+ start:371 stop:1291 length:921 start_codon:yes stop_codon:yes gene_type:complete